MRALLAYFLLHANEAVSTDRLIDDVWGPNPPKTAGASLQNYISRLRKALGPERIVSRPPGYLLRVDPELFDLARFERLTAEARGAPAAERAQKLRAALALWRGRPLEDLAFELFARDEVGRLEEARIAALEDRIDADLELAVNGDLVGELEELVEEHPLRERLRGQLMRALYRAGRQADALAAYQDARRLLMDELGLEPSAELRTLQQAILNQDPSLRVATPAQGERAPDRRTVTVVFCDLVDSTKLAQRLDPEAYRDVISRYFHAVREAIERHGGTLEKFIGDAAMAVFGVPELHEDDALRAVRAAAEARDAVNSLDLPVRVGVNSGEVHVMSQPGEDLHLSGAVLSIASHLQESAPAGEILVGDETFGLVRDAVEVAAHEDPPAWRLVKVLAGAPAYARRIDAPLVGREPELQRLRDAYENARADGRCRVVTVVGEAGIGKTRLIRELLAQVTEETRVLVGRCVSYGEGATYLPIAEIVMQAVPEPSRTAIASMLGGAADADRVAQRIAELAGIAEAPSAPGEAFWAVRRFLEAYASAGPVVVFLDDIHWAEPTLLDLVEYLGEWVDGRLLVVCAARRELLETRPSWGGPTSTGFVVQLEALPAADVSSLITQLSDDALAADVAERIVEHAGGNPLFAEQLVALASEAPELALKDPPPTVEALIASRLDRIDPRELAVLRRASVLGRRFSSEELADVTSDQAKDEARRHLVELTRRALVHPVDAQFRFHHVLVRDVAYRGIPKTERAGLHELAAKGLDRRDGAEELVGYHFEQAYAYLKELGRLDMRAIELAAAGGERLGRAGLRAWRRADSPAAVNLLTRALELTPQRDDLACELGLAQFVGGKVEEAKVLFNRATRASDRAVAARSRLELALLRSFLESNRAGDLLDVASAAIPVLEAAGDSRGLGRAWLAISHARGGFYCQHAIAEEAALRAAGYYRRAGWSPSTALNNLGAAFYFGPKPVKEAIAESEALLAEYEGDGASEANVRVWLAGLEAMRGKFDVARSYVGTAQQRYTELGLTTAAIDDCGRLLGAVELLAGIPEEAEAALRRCCEALQSRQQTQVLATRAGELAEALYEQARYDEATEWTRLARESAGTDDIDAALSWQPVEARLLTLRGALDEAERLARDTLDLASRTDALDRTAKAHLTLAEILTARDRDEEATTSVDRAIELFEQKGNSVSAHRARGLLAALSPAK